MRSPFLLAFSLGSVVAAAALTAVPAHAQATISVPCSGSNGGPTGLVAAINQIGGGSGLIQLAPGCTYTITTPATDTNALPVIIGRIEIEGENSVIARSVGAPDVRVAEVAAGAYLSLTGITVRGGASTLGGGILNSGTLSLKSSMVNDNSAAQGGGILGMPGSLTLLYRSTVSGNTASALAGGVGVAAGTLRAVASNVSGNTAVNAGGGVIVENGAGRLAGTVVTGNRAENGAGVVASRATHMQIERNSQITYNVARRNGGGLYVEGGTTEITGSSVTHNIAGDAGGGIFNTANVNLTGTTVADNEPNDCGGPSPVPGCGGGSQARVQEAAQDQRAADQGAADRGAARTQEASRTTGKTGGTSAGKHHAKRFRPVSGSLFSHVKTKHRR